MLIEDHACVGFATNCPALSPVYKAQVFRGVSVTKADEKPPTGTTHVFPVRQDHPAGRESVRVEPIDPWSNCIEYLQKNPVND